MSRRQGAVKQEKVDYEEKLNDLIENHKRILFCTFENVRSQHIHQIRRDIRGRGSLIMGKKTLQRKIVLNRTLADEATDMDKTLNDKSIRMNLLRGMTGLLFTNAEVAEMEKVFLAHRIQAPARVGAISPCDVVVPAGNTGIEPTQTSFFQALGIATKIIKGTIEITSAKKVLSTGDKVDSSTAALLKKLKISPFFYAMEIRFVWDNGVVFTPDDLSITDDDLEAAMVEGVTNVVALTSGAGIPTDTTVAATATQAFKNLLAASIGSDYVFTEFGADKVRSDALEGKLAAAAPAAETAPAETSAPAPAAAPAAEAEESDDDFGMGGLF